jgi:hypothetical protein
MKNLKIIGKVATFFGAISVVFVVLSAIVTYKLIQIASPTAPTDYVAYYVLSTVLPYLFVAVLSLIIAVVLRGVGKESLEKQAVSTAQNTTAVA